MIQKFGPQLERTVGDKIEMDRVELDVSLESIQPYSSHLTNEDTEDQKGKVIYTGTHNILMIS